jgi:hypothetical protein
MLHELLLALSGHCGGIFKDNGDGIKVNKTDHLQCTCTLHFTVTVTVRVRVGCGLKFQYDTIRYDTIRYDTIRYDDR